MEGGETYGFKLTDVYVGDDQKASPSAPPSSPGPTRQRPRASRKVKSVPASQRLLMDTVAQAIDEAGDVATVRQTGRSSRPSMMELSASAITPELLNVLGRTKTKQNLLSAKAGHLYQDSLIRTDAPIPAFRWT